MTIDELVEYFIKYPQQLTVGKGFLSRRKKVTELNIVIAKRLAKEKLGISHLNGYIRDYKSQKSNNPNNKEKLPLKILIFDIETAPMKAYVWKRWKENISLDLTISEWFLLCWSAKWLYSDEVMGECLTPEEVFKEDDSRIVKSLWDLFNKADIIVSHNGNKFDIPKMNSRFIVNDLTPPSSYFSVDTCYTAKKVFGFSSNKLDALATYFGFKHKLETNFNLWKECMEGNQESLDYMLKYNKRDVTLLEEVYLKLRPWIKNHPNIANIINEDVCPFCGKKHYHKIDNLYHTSVNTYVTYRCDECGGTFRDRKSLSTNKEIKTHKAH